MQVTKFNHCEFLKSDVNVGISNGLKSNFSNFQRAKLKADSLKSFDTMEGGESNYSSKIRSTINT